MRIGIITADRRAEKSYYDASEPCFGSTTTTLLREFSKLTEHEIHILSCSKKAMLAPTIIMGTLNYHLLVVPQAGWLRTLYFGCIRKIKTKLKTIRPDVVLALGSERYPALAAVCSGFPNAIRVFGNMQEIARKTKAPIGSYLWIHSILEKYVIRKTDCVICNSGYTRNLLIKSAKRTEVISNTIRHDFFQPLPGSENKKNDQPHILNIGVISDRKQQQKLLETAYELRANGCNFDLTFIGPANKRESCVKAFFKLLNSTFNTGFVHYCENMDVSSLIQHIDSAHALIHCPSQEAFGLVVVEASARNLQVFSFDEGGIKDIAENIPEIAVSPAGDWGHLKNNISSWIKDGYPQPASACAKVRKRYHPDNFAVDHVSVLKKTIKNKP
ncbi:glycosyltransferase family 4 protein [Verrucomicrobiota bacterium]